ncbi:MAG: radical SAM family heme chaperone HemW [Elusimicrobiota bacterium]
MTERDPGRRSPSARGPRPTPGLYVHVPFCSIKCFYCDFTAFSGQRSQVGRYLSALEREAKVRPGPRPETLYVGGGTPSELPVEALAELFGILSRRYGRLEDLREVTVETSPESLDAEKLDVLRRAGVSRLSIGLQTTEDRLLKAIGRKHGWEDFRKVYGDAVARGFSPNVDLMLGLPGQSLSGALGSLRQLIDLGPDHLSVYALKVEDRTLFSRRKVAVDEDLSREMLEAAIETLARAGYRHYEISNFARPGKESVHNTNYWLNGSYIGLGCGAAGHLDGVRYENDDRLPDYCAKIERGESPAIMTESLAGKAKAGEDLLLGLRLIDGVLLTPAMRRHFSAELEALRRRGLVELVRSPRTGTPRLARLTREGVFLANEAFRSFVAPFDSPDTPVESGGPILSSVER